MPSPALLGPSTAVSSSARRRLGLLATASLAAYALIGAAVPAAAADPAPEEADVACNNIESGGRSPGWVQVALSAAGLLVTWATDEDHFGTGGTVVVRACVFDADGPDEGAIAQNTSNDGQELFAWSLFGLAADPCPDGDLSFGGSVSGGDPAIETKKSDIIDCPAGGGTPPPGGGTPPPGGGTPPPGGGEAPAAGSPSPTLPSTSADDVPGDVGRGPLAFLLVLLAAGAIGLIALDPLPRRGP